MKDKGSNNLVNELLEMQRKHEYELSEVEGKIYEAEGAYLREGSAGNVIKGWEGYLDTKGLSQATVDALVNKKAPVRVEMRDRYFSFSSMSAPQEDGVSSIAASTVTDFAATYARYGDDMDSKTGQATKT